MKWFSRREPEYEYYVGLFGDEHLINKNTISNRIVDFWLFSMTFATLFVLSIPLILLGLTPLIFVVTVHGFLCQKMPCFCVIFDVFIEFTAKICNTFDKMTHKTP